MTRARGGMFAWAAFFAALLAVPFVLHTVIEEQMFRAHFGDAWNAYAARVPRLVPGWTPRAAKTTA